MTLLKKIILVVCLCATFKYACFAYDGTKADNTDENSYVYETQIMADMAESLYSPEDNVTLYRAVAVANSLNAAYYGRSIDSASSEYGLQACVEYAKKYGIIKDNEYTDFSSDATRSDLALLVTRSLPKECFEKINDIPSIPDCDENAEYYGSVLSLYNGGIFTGSDEYGSFCPKNNVTWEQMRMVVDRVLHKEKRINFSPVKYTDDEAYILCYQERGMTGQKEGISSGWQYDNRGGTPKISNLIDYNSLVDVKDDDSVAMIREFNNTDTGVLNLETQIFITENTFDGFVLEYQNEDSQTVYRLYTKNGCFYVDTPSGPVDITGNVCATATFVLNIEVDIDNGVSKTAIDKVDRGEFPLCTQPDNTNIQRLILGTTDEDKTIVSLTNVYITANYGFYDLFEMGRDGKIPYGWNGKNAVNSNGMLTIDSKGYASRSFKPVSGVVAANTEFNLTSGQQVEVLLLSDGKTVGKFSTDESSFMFGNNVVYSDYVYNMWYRLRIEADTVNDVAKVWINGRTVATLPLDSKVSYIDEMRINNLSDSAVNFDVINVFERKEHDDYVPEPVKPKGEEKYLIGMNICSLWKNGEHYGWACISPYADREPVLGYYDEGNPETADWEIKFMVEHGIDFQAFCWYADQSDAPMKKMHLSPHLYDGYMYSKYSDRMKYCLIWEAANAQAPKNLEAWNKYYVPYFIENFFKDERYLVIDNKPVLSVFGQTKLVEKIGGSPELLKQMFDSLEEEVKKLGFSGMIYLACGSASSAVEEMGFDGVHAYGWGNNGYQVSINQSSILRSAAYKGNVYTVPTISVGFNSVPWHNIRYPIMTAEDYEISHEWVRDEYLPTYAEKGTWKENLVWLSTWNEYGEGTYLMPCEGNCGFGYLDALRKAYSDEKGECTHDIALSANQKRRINRLYPQHLRILRKEGYYKETINYDTLKNVYTINYTKKTDNMYYSNIKDVNISSEGFYGVMNGDGIINVENISVDAEKAQIVAVTVDAKPGTKVEVFFITDADSKWTQDKSGSFYAEETGMRTSFIDMSLNDAWTGKIIALRVDVGHCEKGTGTVENNAFTLKKSEFMQKNVPSKYIVINGLRFEMQLPYVVTEEGDYCIAFDPKIGMDYRLGFFMEWDKFTKTLTLDNGSKNVVYTVGKNTCIANGKEVKMGYTLTEFDGLPLLDVVQLCYMFGYDVDINYSNEIEITTHEYDYYVGLQQKDAACWEFETLGDVEGWNSSNMSLFAFNGYMRLETIVNTTDPIMSQRNPMALNASDYKTIKIRCRYKYNATRKQDIAIYYTTDEYTTMSEATGFRIPLPSVDSGGEWVEVSFDLTTEENWKGTITGLRFDPFSTTGVMEIDYIRIE